MGSSGQVLLETYPGEFTEKALSDHIDDLLCRFQNRNLGDTVFRVGCDLYRKLGPGDRLVAPIHAAIKVNKPYDLIMKVLKAALLFRATDEHGDHLPADIAFFRETEKGTSCQGTRSTK